MIERRLLSMLHRIRIYLQSAYVNFLPPLRSPSTWCGMDATQQATVLASAPGKEVALIAVRTGDNWRIAQACSRAHDYYEDMHPVPASMD